MVAHARGFVVFNFTQQVRGARVFGDRFVVQVNCPGLRINHHIFQDGAKAVGHGVDLWLFLRREVDGVQLGEMVLERHIPKKLSFAKLKTKAEKLSEQVNYLKERLEIVDHDRRGMYIQLRSLPPYKDDTQIQFNEISIGKNKIVVKRIAFYRKEEVKQQVPLQLSELELKRLLFDIRQAIA